MADFLEERIDARAYARYGCTFVERFALDPSESAGGAHHVRLIHPYPQREWDFSSLRAHADLFAGLLALYWRAYGQYAGFRLKAWDEWSTASHTGAPAPTDQPMALVSGLIYQIQKQYGAGGTPLGIGLPVRKIYKPVAGTTRVAIGGVEITNAGATRWTVDTTTGRVTFSADKTKSITSITQASQAVLTVGASHGYVANDVVHISGVSGMTQINGLRAAVTATGASTITVAINSSAFSAYTSGGVTHTVPQTSPATEAVTAGCEFDFPVHFASDLSPAHSYPSHSEIGTVMLRELLNP